MKEADVVTYLTENKDFFERNPHLIEQIKVPSQYGGRAISLQERNIEILRERVKVFELRMDEFLINAEHNQNKVDRLLAWFTQLTAEQDLLKRASTVSTSICAAFDIEYAALRLWPVEANPLFDWSIPTSEADKSFITGLSTPYCGPNDNFQMASWFDNKADIQSLALVALRYRSSSTDTGNTFGAILLGSSNENRFQNNMSIYLLDHLGTMASAILWPLALSATMSFQNG